MRERISNVLRSAVYSIGASALMALLLAFMLSLHDQTHTVSLPVLLWAGLLLALLAVGIWSAWKMVTIHDPLETMLNRASEQALEENWDSAEYLFQQAKDCWESRETFRACFADHTPVEEIDGEFALLEVYLQTREHAAFAAGCRELARKTAAVGEAHGLDLKNLL